jgi:hypothetical protein
MNPEAPVMATGPCKALVERSGPAVFCEAIRDGPPAGPSAQ